MAQMNDKQVIIKEKKTAINNNIIISTTIMYNIYIAQGVHLERSCAIITIILELFCQQVTEVVGDSVVGGPDCETVHLQRIVGERTLWKCAIHHTHYS